MKLSELAPGQRISHRYVLRKELGTGGTGSVYLVFDEGLEEEIAIKILQKHVLEKPGVLSRFKREVRLTRRVAHTNVVRMFDFGYDAEKNLYFLTMEYVEGKSLASSLKEEQAYSLDKAIPILRAICDGLAAAHQEEILHLDLKPDNILISEQGRVIITDFGIARHLRGLDSFQSHRGELLGTPTYMAPEQFQGRDTLDFRTDIYAVGAIAYEMLTGQQAWKGENFYSVAMGRFFQPPPNPKAIVPTLSDELAELIMRCMALKPAERYDSIQAVINGLQQTKRRTAPAAAQDDLDESDTVFTSFAQRTEVLPTDINSLKGLHAAVAAPLEPEPGELTALHVNVHIEAREPVSIAVIPLQTKEGPDNAYLRATMTEELMRLLSKEYNFQVSAKGLTLPFESKTPTSGEIRRALGVQLWLGGTLQQSGNSLLLDLTLGETKHETQLWRKQFATNTVGLLETCRTIANEVNASSLGQETPQPQSNDTDTSEKNSLLLQALHALRSSWHTDPDRAVQIFEQISQHTPEEQHLLIGGAVAYARQAYLYEAPHSEAAEKAWHLVRRAVALAPDQPEVYYAMAMLYVIGNAWGEALNCLRWSLRLDPSLAEAHDLCGRILLEVGDLQEALHHLRLAMTQNPNLPGTRWVLIRAYALQAQWSHMDEIFLWPLNNEYEQHFFAINHARYNLWRPTPEILELHRELNQEDMTEMGIQCFLDVLQTRQFSPAERQRYLHQRLTRTNSPRIRTLMLQELAEILAYTMQWDACLETIQHALSIDLVDRNWLRLCPLFATIHRDHHLQHLSRQLDEAISARGIVLEP